MDDSALVAATLEGDRDAFAEIYDRYGQQLWNHCRSVLRDPDEADDAVSDAFLVAVQRLDQLRDPSRLRPWLYAIARTESLRRLRRRQRVVPTDEVTTMDPHHDDADAPMAAEDAAALVDEVMDGLNERDRTVLDLHVRQGLSGLDLADALGVTEAHAHTLASRLRTQVERALGALLVARHGRRDCAVLAELLVGWDGTFDPTWRKRIARHAEGCGTCGETRRRVASPAALLAGLPLLPLRDGLRARVLGDPELVGALRELPSRIASDPTWSPPTTSGADRAHDTARATMGPDGHVTRGPGPAHSSADAGWWPDPLDVHGPPLEDLPDLDLGPVPIGPPTEAVPTTSPMVDPSSEPTMAQPVVREDTADPGPGGPVPVPYPNVADAGADRRRRKRRIALLAILTGLILAAGSALVLLRGGDDDVAAGSTTTSSSTSTTTTTAPAPAGVPPAVLPGDPRTPVSTTTTTASPTTTTTRPTTTTTTTTAPDTTPPSIQRASASPTEIWERDATGGSCGPDTETTLTVAATDDNGVDEVTATWSVDGQDGTLAFTKVGATAWRTTLGPFEADAVAADDTVSVTVRVTDAAGNDATAVIDVVLHDCP